MCSELDILPESGLFDGQSKILYCTRVNAKEARGREGCEGTQGMEYHSLFLFDLLIRQSFYLGGYFALSLCLLPSKVL